jgi:protein O-GlcNAc transferase
MTLPTQSDAQRQALIDQLFGAFERADLQGALQHAQAITAAWPDFAFGWKALGVVLLERHEYDAALLPLERARALTPDDVEVLNSLGNAYVEHGDAALAEQAYRQAMGLDPSFFDPYKNLARLFVQQAAWQSVDEIYGQMIERWSQSTEVRSTYALALLDQRRFEEAQRHATAVLQVEGPYGGDQSQVVQDALRVCAYSCESLGQFDEAKQSYAQLSLVPSEAIDALLGLVRVSIASDDVSEAFAYLERALFHGCTETRAKTVLGEAFLKSGKFDHAVQALESVVALNGSDPVVWGLLGRAYIERGTLRSALNSFLSASVLNPGDVTNWNNLGVTYLRLHLASEARQAFEKAIDLNPNDALAHANLSEVLSALGLVVEAKSAIKRSLEINKNDASSHLILAKIYYESLDIKLAQYECNEALRLDPNYTPALNYMAHMAQDNGNNALAILLVQRALSIDPENAVLHLTLGSIYRTIGQFKISLESYIKGLQINPSDANGHSNMLFAMNYVGEVSTGTAVAHARRYGELVASQANMKYTDWHGREAGERLRIGFVSGDLRSHPVGYFVEALLAHLAFERFDLYAYSTVKDEDDLTVRVKSKFASWRTIAGLSHEQSARIIHEDGVHVLVDLAGHTGNTGLPIFSFKPAPIQVAYLGYFATTGVAEIDYILGDPYVTPECDADHFSEKIWQLPDSYWCYTPPDQTVTVSALPALKNKYITFGCFNNTSKINPKVLDLWADILRDLPTAKLMLKAGQLGDVQLQQTIINEFVARGIEMGRVTCQGWSNMDDYLKAYGEVDVALDPFPFPGGTTSMDGLWMGVPVISMRGDRMVGHNAETIAHNLGLTSWLCSDADEYHAKALFCAQRTDELALMRGSLRERMRQSPLMDGQRFATHVGNAFEQMYSEWQQGQQHPNSAGALRHDD